MSDNYADIISSMFDKPPPATADPKPLPQVRGKRIDGVLYLHADDVADALASQAPKANRRLIDRIRRTS